MAKQSFKRLLVAAVTFFGARQMSAQAVVPPQVRTAADRISETQIRTDIDYLASDALRGRDTFSPGLDSAARFIVRRLRRAGLKPFGDSGTYLQHYVLKGGTADTSAMFLEIGGQRFRFGEFLTNPFTGSIDTTASVVFVGHGARIPSMNIDAYTDVDVNGKFVLAQMVPPTGVSFDNSPLDTQGPRVASKALGAIAALFITTPPTLKIWTEIQSNPFYRSYAELVPPVPIGAPQPITSILLKPEQIRLLLAPNAGIAERILNRQPGAEFPPAFELSQLVRVYIPSIETRRTSYNIVALIKGSDPQLNQEYVTVAAHLDGALQPPLMPGDSVFNAADDNASGSAGILAVAEAMMRGPRPRRSVMFIWDTGHERGLFGSQAFIGKAIVPLKNIVAHFNIDMIGSTAGPQDAASTASRIPAQAHEAFVIGPRVLSTELDSLVERTNRSYLNMRLNHKYDNADTAFFYPRTDARPFIEHGIPTIEFTTGLTARYHRSNDEARYLDTKKIQEVSRTLTATMWAVANTPQRPVLDKGFPSRVFRVP